MANDAGTPRKNRKRRRKRKRKKIMMTGASLTRTAKKIAKIKDHHPGQLVPIQPPPAAARNAGEGQQEVEDTAADETAAQRKEPPGEQAEQERTAAATTTACRRDDDDDERATCCICGAVGGHNERFCAWNYMEGNVRKACRAGWCGPGQHAAARRRDALRRFVRVTNLPSSLLQWDLQRLFRRFGPLRMCVIATKLAPPGSAGFGYVAFKEREDAEEAVDKLNGHHVGDRRLRVDWAYPRA